MSKITKQKSFALLGGLFIGMLSFSKSEGLLAALLIMAMSYPYFAFKFPKEKGIELFKTFALFAFFSFLPTIIFKLIYAPENLTFINGFTSTEHPFTILRLKSVFAFYVLEIGSLFWNGIVLFKINPSLDYIPVKWSCIWLFFIVALISSKTRCINKTTIIFPLFFILYGSIITVYYLMNTQFGIEWWLQVTLSRVMFAVLPTCFFWVFYSVWYEEGKLK